MPDLDFFLGERHDETALTPLGNGERWIEVSGLDLSPDARWSTNALRDWPVDGRRRSGPM